MLCLFGVLFRSAPTQLLFPHLLEAAAPAEGQQSQDKQGLREFKECFNGLALTQHQLGSP